MTLPAFASERRVAACCWASAPATVGGSAHSRTALSSKPAARRCCCRSMGQTDGLTDARPFHRPCSAYYAGSVSNVYCVDILSAIIAGPRRISRASTPVVRRHTQCPTTATFNHLLLLRRSSFRRRLRRYIPGSSCPAAGPSHVT